ncbi:MAG: acyl-CoA dehydratase activase-related protein [Spirochaetia bacterium]|nr:acyl-CoA dehydratase activase-related protein [Spirochaetia bacterium]
MKSGWKKIGVPRGFSYYLYPAFFETFFHELGFEVADSGKTSRDMLRASQAFSETEHCLSHKIFDAHLFALAGKADAVFVPRILSMTKNYLCCAKFGAVPDAGRSVLLAMTRAAGVRGMAVLSMDINETKEPLKKTALRFAAELGAGKARSRCAWEKASEAMKAAFGRQDERNRALSGRGRFLLLGHSYTLGEPLIMEPVLKKLSSLNIKPEPSAASRPLEIMSFHCPPEPFKGGFSPFGGMFSFEMPTPVRWCFASKMRRKLQTLDAPRYAGVIWVSVFNCGPDSVMGALFREVCGRKSIPFLELLIDEHTAAAGIDTRIEAFVDSLEWRKARQCV